MAKYTCPTPELCGVKKYHDDPANCLSSGSAGVGGVGLPQSALPDDGDDMAGEEFSFIDSDGEVIDTPNALVRAMDPTFTRTAVEACIDDYDNDPYASLSHRTFEWRDYSIAMNEGVEIVAEKSALAQSLAYEGHADIWKGPEGGAVNPFSDSERAGIKEAMCLSALDGALNITARKNPSALFGGRLNRDDALDATDFLNDDRIDHRSDLSEQDSYIDTAARMHAPVAVHDFSATAAGLVGLVESTNGSLFATAGDDVNDYLRYDQTPESGAQEIADKYGVTDPTDRAMIVDTLRQTKQDTSANNYDYQKELAVGLHMRPSVRDVEASLWASHSDGRANTQSPISQGVLQVGEHKIPLEGTATHHLKHNLLVHSDSNGRDMMPAGTVRAHPGGYSEPDDGQSTIF